jgi:hypothetical protein
VSKRAQFLRVLRLGVAVVVLREQLLEHEGLLDRDGAAKVGPDNTVM